MSVHFIAAGPGAADLITVPGRDLIARCGVCLYAGSLSASSGGTPARASTSARIPGPSGVAAPPARVRHPRRQRRQRPVEFEPPLRRRVVFLCFASGDAASVSWRDVPRAAARCASSAGSGAPASSAIRRS